MTELEQLIEQREELDAKIEALTNRVYKFGGVRFAKYEWQSGGKWIFESFIPRTGCWHTFVMGKTKEQAVDMAKTQIKEMNKLLKMIERDDNV